MASPAVRSIFEVVAAKAATGVPCAALAMIKRADLVSGLLANPGMLSKQEKRDLAEYELVLAKRRHDRKLNLLMGYAAWAFGSPWVRRVLGQSQPDPPAADPAALDGFWRSVLLRSALGIPLYLAHYHLLNWLDRQWLVPVPESLREYV